MFPSGSPASLITRGVGGISHPTGLGGWQRFSQPPLQLECRHVTRIRSRTSPRGPLDQKPVDIQRPIPGGWWQLRPAPARPRDSMASKARPGQQWQRRGLCPVGSSRVCTGWLWAPLQAARVPGDPLACPTPASRDVSLYPLPLVQTCLVPLISQHSVCTRPGRGCVCLFKQLFITYFLCARHRVSLNKVTSFVLASTSC